MKKQTNLTLPEWAFLDAKTHKGNELTGRDVLLHVRSNTVLEFFNHDETEIHLHPSVRSREFTYASKYGVKERYTVAIHYSLAEFSPLYDIIDKAILFYKDWMTWMDATIETEETSKIN